MHPRGDVVSDGGAYRKIEGILTLYRFVFHANGMSVLPGTL